MRGGQFRFTPGRGNDGPMSSICLTTPRRLPGSGRRFPNWDVGQRRVAAWRAIHGNAEFAFWLDQRHLVTDTNTALFRYSMQMPKDVVLSLTGRPLRSCGSLGYCASGVTVEVSGRG